MKMQQAEYISKRSFAHWPASKRSNPHPWYIGLEIVPKLPNNVMRIFSPVPEPQCFDVRTFKLYPAKEDKEAFTLFQVKIWSLLQILYLHFMA